VELALMVSVVPMIHVKKLLEELVPTQLAASMHETKVRMSLDKLVIRLSISTLWLRVKQNTIIKVRQKLEMMEFTKIKTKGLVS
jgi:hypothetical protein